MAPAAVWGLTVGAVELPLREPVRTASGVMTSTPAVLLDVRGGDGLVGRSYLRTYTPLALSSLVRLLEDLTPELVGRCGPAPQTIQSIRERFRLLGDSGLVGIALAGLDMALWDLDAQRAGVSLAQLLGADREEVAAYRPLIAVEPGPAVAEAARALEAGFDAVKVKVGHGRLPADVAVVSALRAAIGPSRELMVDYNQSLTAHEALTRARALHEYGLSWLEEPLPARDLLGYARLVAASPVPIGAGESLEGVAEIATALELKAVGVLTLDLARVGGVTGWRAVAGLAARAGIPVCSHGFPEFSVHLLAASPTGRWLEYHDYLAPILAHPLAVEQGSARVPSGPGVGLEWNEAALRTLPSPPTVRSPGSEPPLRRPG